MRFQKISPCLWFDGQAEEAMNFYTSIFRNSKKGDLVYWPKEHGPAGKVLTASFELEGLQFLALNGGPQFKFNESISMSIACETQEEIDYFWDKLGEGGTIQQCGWLKDKFGLSWQIAPAMMPKLLKDPAKAGRVMAAFMQMKKFDIAAIEKAAAG